MRLTIIILIGCLGFGCAESPKKAEREPKPSLPTLVDVQNSLNVYMDRCKEAGGIPVLELIRDHTLTLWNMRDCVFPPKEPTRSWP